MPDIKEKLGESVEQNVDKSNDLVDLKSRDDEKVSKDVERWVERIEKDPIQMKTINDSNGQPLLTPATSTTPKVVLPITRKKFVAGFKKKVDDAGRWLSTFILRLIKIKDGEVEFKK